MQIPLRITFRNMEPSDAIEAKIAAQVRKLEKYYKRITGCKVLVEAPHQHHRQGKLYHVQVDLTIPRKEIVANRNPPLKHQHEDVYVAIRDAFRSVRRRLEDSVRFRRGEAKTHETPPLGKIIELFPKEGYGTIGAPDGREIYFHHNSVLTGEFKNLTVGTEVHFVEEMGIQGPQASTVKVIKPRKTIKR